MSPAAMSVPWSPIAERTAWNSTRRYAGTRPRLSRSGRRLVVGLLLSAPLSVPWGAAAAWAGERGVIVTTKIVMASNDGVAKLRGPELVSLERSLRHFPYTSYRLLQSESRPVVMEKMAEFPVPGGRHLLVQPTGYKNGRVSLYVMLMHGQRTLVNTVLRLRNRGEFVVAGPRHGDGVLFLSIGVRMQDDGSRVVPVGGSR